MAFHPSTPKAERRTSHEDRPPREHRRRLPLLALGLISAVGLLRTRDDAPREGEPRLAPLVVSESPARVERVPLVLPRARGRRTPSAEPPTAGGPPGSPAASVPTTEARTRATRTSTLHLRARRAGRAVAAEVELTHGTEGEAPELRRLRLPAGGLTLELPPGRVRAVALAERALSAPACGRLLPGRSEELVLELAPARAVEGRVVSALDGEPVPGARVAF